jgi:hypothetical protein
LLFGTSCFWPPLRNRLHDLSRVALQDGLPGQAPAHPLDATPDRARSGCGVAGRRPSLPAHPPRSPRAPTAIPPSQPWPVRYPRTIRFAAKISSICGQRHAFWLTHKANRHLSSLDRINGIVQNGGGRIGAHLRPAPANNPENPVNPVQNAKVMVLDHSLANTCHPLASLPHS